MGRPRTASIYESLKKISELESQHAGTAREERVAMLKAMKEDPSLTLAEVGAVIGRPEPTVNRWWGTYRRGGVGALLEVRPAGGKRPPRIDGMQSERLAATIEQSELDSYRQIQELIFDEHGVSYSLSGVRHLVRNRLGLRSAGRVGRTGRQGGSFDIVSEKFVAFLNALPIDGTSDVWGRQFQNMLLELFPDVDKVVFAVNFQCDLMNLKQRQGRETVVISRHLEPEDGTVKSVNVMALQAKQPHAARIVEAYIRRGFPFENYHTPCCFEYLHQGREYLGVIILLNEKGNGRVGTHTVETLTRLEPFITFLLAHLVVRNHYFNPVDISFFSNLERLMQEVRLGVQQVRILTHLLLGRSYKDIAGILSIAEGTVKKQLNLIYQKTGTRSHNELFAKYFTLRHPGTPPR